VNDIVERLTEVLKDRRNAEPSKSYVARLHHEGLDQILKKVGEEAAETIMAAKDLQHQGDPNRLIKETADLWFHTMVMLDHLGETPNNVLVELEKRFGISGHDEKRARQKQE